MANGLESKHAASGTACATCLALIECWDTVRYLCEPKSNYVVDCSRNSQIQEVQMHYKDSRLGKMTEVSQEFYVPITIKVASTPLWLKVKQTIQIRIYPCVQIYIPNDYPRQKPVI